jgi:hypothetical protein
MVIRLHRFTDFKRMPIGEIMAAAEERWWEFLDRARREAGTEEPDVAGGGREPSDEFLPGLGVQAPVL